MEVYTAQDQHFKIQILNLWMNWEKLWPNLSITTVEIRWGIHLKKLGHILNLTKVIGIPKILRIYQ